RPLCSRASPAPPTRPTAAEAATEVAASSLRDDPSGPRPLCSWASPAPPTRPTAAEAATEGCSGVAPRRPERASAALFLEPLRLRISRGTRRFSAYRDSAPPGGQQDALDVDRPGGLEQPLADDTALFDRRPFHDVEHPG